MAIETIEETKGGGIMQKASCFSKMQGSCGLSSVYVFPAS